MAGSAGWKLVHAKSASDSWLALAAEFTSHAKNSAAGADIRSSLLE